MALNGCATLEGNSVRRYRRKFLGLLEHLLKIFSFLYRFGSTRVTSSLLAYETIRMLKQMSSWSTMLMKLETLKLMEKFQTQSRSQIQSPLSTTVLMMTLNLVMTLEKMTKKILTTSEHYPRIANWIISFGAQVPFFILNTTSSLISCQHYGEGTSICSILSPSPAAELGEGEWLREIFSVKFLLIPS